MKKLIPLILILLCGCASYKIFTASAVVSGNNLITPAGGPVAGQIKYHTVTCVGQCPKISANDIEVIGNANNF